MYYEIKLVLFVKRILRRDVGRELKFGKTIKVFNMKSHINDLIASVIKLLTYEIMKYSPQLLLKLLFGFEEFRNKHESKNVLEHCQ